VSRGAARHPASQSPRCPPRPGRPRHPTPTRPFTLRLTPAAEPAKRYGDQQAINACTLLPLSSAYALGLRLLPAAYTDETYIEGDVPPAAISAQHPDIGPGTTSCAYQFVDEPHGQGRGLFIDVAQPPFSSWPDTEPVKTYDLHDLRVALLPRPRPTGFDAAPYLASLSRGQDLYVRVVLFTEAAESDAAGSLKGVIDAVATTLHAGRFTDAATVSYAPPYEAAADPCLLFTAADFALAAPDKTPVGRVTRRAGNSETKVLSPRSPGGQYSAETRCTRRSDDAHQDGLGVHNSTSVTMTVRTHRDADMARAMVDEFLDPSSQVSDAFGASVGVDVAIGDIAFVAPLGVEWSFGVLAGPFVVSLEVYDHGAYLTDAAELVRRLAPVARQIVDRLPR